MRAIVLAALTALLGVPTAATEPTWHGATSPNIGPPRAIGGYAAGCLSGGHALPPDGAGYQVIRQSRRRVYGHPALIDYVRDFGRRLAAAGDRIAIIGDLAQPRGGPMDYGHVSHQSGLDVDIWLRLDLPRLPVADRERLEERSMVADDGRTMTDAWGDAQVQLVRLAADDSRVARIFVSPAIKRSMCNHAWTDRSWLRRLRPWFGHTAHMHVRLGCPTDSPECRPQAPPPPGDGCGTELASWFSPATGDGGGRSASRPRPKQPAGCQRVLTAPSAPG